MLVVLTGSTGQCAVEGVLTRKNAPPPGSHFHEDRTVNVASVKNAPPLGSHVFQANIIIFYHIQDIIQSNLLTKFHEDWTINVASRVLTRKNAPLLFHDDQKINVTSRVLTSQPASPPAFANLITMNPLQQPCFFTDLNHFQLNRHIQKTNVLTKFHEHWTKNVTNINETNVLNKFHDDWAKIVTSRVFTRKTAPPPGGHVHEDWASNVTSTVFTSFELSGGINGTNVLTKVFTRQMLTEHDARQTKGHHKSSP
ncbi:hypothetical protein DPMN_041292 [Dreissena polymorpha]|uniref:Uncharacterized protein n=1 Tax=Dreissena polymorpha TaxID=45954 RepID=A0A9D4HVW1_DREPO|nr:hypothetical protein DPMN_041292 [Dreissena polymorpha]